MAQFILFRLSHTVLILFGVSVVAFGLIHLIPGNPLDILLPPEAPKEVVERLKVEFGFDQPLYIQYFAWLGRVLHGNLGTSVFTGLQVTHELLNALGNTLLLAVPAAILGFSLGTLFGTLAAFNHGRWLDKLFSIITILGLSMPHYWLGIALVIVFAVLWPVLPAAGMGSTGGIPTSWEEIRCLILPVTTLAMIPMGVIGRMVRSTVLEILSQEFPTALRAKGLRRRRVVFHVLKNAAPPALAVMGLQLGYLLGGSILVETVYNWPGSGQFMNLAIFRRDIPVLQGTVLVLASFFVMLNLMVDVVQALIDPGASGADDTIQMDGTAPMTDVAATLPPQSLDGEADTAPKGYWSTVLDRLLRDRATLVVAALLLTIILLAVFAPWAATHDPLQGGVMRRLKPVGTPGFFLGTDETGRDIWSRLVYGGRLSLICGITPVVFATMIGGSLGLLAGVGGRFVNMLIMRVVDVFYAFPSVLLAIAICGVMGAGIGNTLLSLTVVFIPPLVRVTESLTTQVKSRDFVEAARASAAPLVAIIRHQILPNVLGGILVYSTSLVSISIILSAGLSFLGLGVTPPNPEWGLMLNALRQAIFVNPLVAALPGVAIVLTSLCFNLLSDGLRSAMDIKLPS